MKVDRSKECIASHVFERGKKWNKLDTIYHAWNLMPNQDFCIVKYSKKNKFEIPLHKVYALAMWLTASFIFLYPWKVDLWPLFSYNECNTIHAIQWPDSLTPTQITKPIYLLYIKLCTIHGNGELLFHAFPCIPVLRFRAKQFYRWKKSNQNLIFHVFYCCCWS